MASAGNISPVNIIFFKRLPKETFPLFLRDPNTQKYKLPHTFFSVKQEEGCQEFLRNGMC